MAVPGAGPTEPHRALGSGATLLPSHPTRALPGPRPSSSDLDLQECLSHRQLQGSIFVTSSLPPSAPLLPPRWAGTLQPVPAVTPPVPTEPLPCSRRPRSRVGAGRPSQTPCLSGKRCPCRDYPLRASSTCLEFRPNSPTPLLCDGLGQGWEAGVPQFPHLSSGVTAASWAWWPTLASGPSQSLCDQERAYADVLFPRPGATLPTPRAADFPSVPTARTTAPSPSPYRHAQLAFRAPSRTGAPTRPHQACKAATRPCPWGARVRRAQTSAMRSLPACALQSPGRPEGAQGVISH